ncbi:MAG: hypothetical protein PVJ83_04235 [Gammaproteobacteria bacterium]|jgi:hypothetical protein
MNPHSLLFVDPPDLSDETASEMLDFLYQLITAFENHYAAQLRRYYQEADRSQPDLFEDFNDELPPF